jgi:tetratricopeptide (TPR) repeat protein
VDGDFGAAVDYAQRAIATVTEQDLPQEHARALRELGRACRAAGRHEEAERHWRAAITWFDGAGFTVEADELRQEIVGDCPPRPAESADRTLLGSLGG